MLKKWKPVLFPLLFQASWPPALCTTLCFFCLLIHLSHLTEIFPLFSHNRELNWAVELSSRATTRCMAGDKGQHASLYPWNCTQSVFHWQTAFQPDICSQIPRTGGYCHNQTHPLCTDGLHRVGWESLDNKGIRLNSCPQLEHSLKFFPALAAPSPIFPYYSACWRLCIAEIFSVLGSSKGILHRAPPGQYPHSIPVPDHTVVHLTVWIPVQSCTPMGFSA